MKSNSLDHLRALDRETCVTHQRRRWSIKVIECVVDLHPYKAGTIYRPVEIREEE
jgi:hypothetical protein